jgi:hypothetical protein
MKQIRPYATADDYVQVAADKRWGTSGVGISDPNEVYPRVAKDLEACRVPQLSLDEPGRDNCGASSEISRRIAWETGAPSSLGRETVTCLYRHASAPTPLLTSTASQVNYCVGLDRRHSSKDHGCRPRRKYRPCCRSRFPSSATTSDQLGLPHPDATHQPLINLGRQRLRSSRAESRTGIREASSNHRRSLCLAVPLPQNPSSPALLLRAGHDQECRGQPRSPATD